LNTLPVDSSLAIGRRVIAGLFCVYIALKKSTIMKKISHLMSPLCGVKLVACACWNNSNKPLPIHEALFFGLKK